MKSSPVTQNFSQRPELPERSQNLWHRAGHFLDRGDQWFASSAGRVFGWAHRESDLVTEQAVHLLGEALGVRKQPASTKPGHARILADQAPSGSRAPDPSDLDLVWADRGSQALDGDAGVDDVDGKLAGLAPLLQALGRVVEQHAEQRYASLAEDDRFWMLVEVIVSLTQTDSPLEKPDGQPGEPVSSGIDVKGAT